MDQGKIVSRAWDITWNHKALWGLGFLAALTTATGGSSNSGNLGNSFNIDPTSGDALPPAFQDGPLADIAAGDIEALIPLAAGLAVFVSILVIVGIVFWIISQAARVGLIRSVVDIDEGRKLTFGDALRSGWSSVFSVFIMKLLLFLMVFVPIAVVVGVVLALGLGAGAEAAFILICPLMCILLPLVFSVQFIDAYGFRGIVLQGMSPTEAIGHGWKLFRANLADSLVLGVIFGIIAFVFNIVVSFAVGLLAFFGSNPIVEYLESGAISTATMISGAVIAIVMSVVLALLNSVIAAWQSVGFTLAYREMTGLAVSAEFPTKEKGPEDVNFNDMI